MFIFFHHNKLLPFFFFSSSASLFSKQNVFTVMSVQTAQIPFGCFKYGTLCLQVNKLCMRSPSRYIQLTLLHDLNFINRGASISHEGLLTFFFLVPYHLGSVASAMIHATINVIIKLNLTSTSTILLSMLLYLQI